jgi:hypothetical protein
VREYKKDNAALVDLSYDGQLILTKGERMANCRGQTRKCRFEVLAVYEARTGNLLRELVSNDDGRFGAPGFMQANRVSAVETTYDSEERKVIRTGLQWDPVSGVRMLR